MRSWYLLCHKAGLENFNRACLSLRQQQHIEIFTPVITTRRKRTDRPGFRELQEPLFYGYLFVATDFEVVHSSALEESPGVSHFVRHGQTIKAVPEYVMAEILALPASQPEEQALRRAQRHRRRASTNALRERICKLATIPERGIRSALFLALVESTYR